MVLRFNSAPTKGFERLVGSKTTHRITNTQNWCFRESDKEHILVHMRSTASLTAVIRTHLVRHLLLAELSAQRLRGGGTEGVCGDGAKHSPLLRPPSPSAFSAFLLLLESPRTQSQLPVGSTSCLP